MYLALEDKKKKQQQNTDDMWNYPWPVFQKYLYL